MEIIIWFPSIKKHIYVISKLQFINQAIKKTARTMNLKSSPTVYHKWGKGVKNKLIFSKSGNENIERSYATHYLDVKRINELKRDDKDRGLCQ